MPIRVQRKRTQGWTMPPNTVYVGRPSKWGNVYQIMLGTTRESAVALYRRHIRKQLDGLPSATDIQSELYGKNLACWCPLVDQEGHRVSCHADVLLEIANSELVGQQSNKKVEV